MNRVQLDLDDVDVLELPVSCRTSSALAGGSTTLTIPNFIAQRLKLKTGDVLKVAIVQVFRKDLGK